MSKTVSDVMTLNARTISRHGSVVEAAKTMLDEDVGSVPVLDDDGMLCGIVTDRDIALRVVAAGRDPQMTRVEDIATTDPHCASPDESLDDAYERMTTWRIRRCVRQPQRAVRHWLPRVSLRSPAPRPPAGRSSCRGRSATGRRRPGA